MKASFRSTAFFVLILVFTSCLSTLRSGSYCYICCACVGSGSLRVFDNGCFEIEYERFERPRDRSGKIYYGHGTCRVEKGTIDLFFEDIPKVNPVIKLTKIGESDKIDIRLDAVFDSVNMIPVQGAHFAARERTGNKNIKAELYYDPHQENHLILDSKKSLKGSLSSFFLEASFIGCRTASCEMPLPGLYVANVMLPFGYADVQFDAGLHKTFKVRKTLDGVMIRDESDPKLYFTTQSCGCD